MKNSYRRCLDCYLWAAVLLIIVFFSGCAGKPASPEMTVSYNFSLSPEAEDLVRKGIEHHDRRDFDAAINYYIQALELAPDHPVIYYEMGFSYVSMGDFDTALEMADKGIDSAKRLNYAEVIPSLLDLKGITLSNLGRHNEAIETYHQVINEYGVSTTFLYYNLGVSYYRMDRREEAIEVLSKALLINPNHVGSNYLLGRICMEDGKPAQAFYALCYFLILEPNSERAAQSYNTVLHMLTGQNETIGFRDNGTFTPADVIISVAFTLDEANFRLSDEDKIRAKLHYVFSNLEEQKNSDRIKRSDGDELWWDFYAPFFYRIAGSEYFSTFCRYIGLTRDPNANDWITNGREEIEGFFEWLNEY